MNNKETAPGITSAQDGKNLLTEIVFQSYKCSPNPSYPIAPHCTIKPRYCYCLQKDGLKVCDVKAYNDLCFKNLVVLVIKNTVKDKGPFSSFFNAKDHIEYERLTEREVFDRVGTSPENSKRLLV